MAGQTSEGGRFSVAWSVVGSRNDTCLSLQVRQ